jgi:hypothetical protein
LANFKLEKDDDSLAKAREVINKTVFEAGVYCGAPLPLDGSDDLVISPNMPYAEAFERESSSENDDLEVANVWWSRHEQGYVTVIHKKIKDESGNRIGSKYHSWYLNDKKSIDLLMKTLMAAPAWSVEAEIKAQELLRRHISKHKWEDYFMTGMFVETSRKSGLTYVFRKLKPTIVLNIRDLRILCTLCTHGIGYYANSFAGAMVPTDDVVTHLLMMRGNEHRYWRDCNQAEPWMPEAGI